MFTSRSARPWRGMPRWATLGTGLSLSSALLVGCGGGGSSGDNGGTPPPPPPPEIQATVRITSYGVPHIDANDYQSAAYAGGYVYAKDYVCMVADKMMSVAGERSRYLGASAAAPDTGTTNLNSDFYYRAVISDEALARANTGISTDAQALLQGYVRGFNRWLREAKPEDIPADCRGKPWLRPITVQDMQRMNLDRATTPGMAGFIAQIGNAQPPVVTQAAAAGKAASHNGRTTRTALVTNKRALQQIAQNARVLGDELDHPMLGSNGVALGRDVTDNGTGMLLANPHFPWDGMRRMYQMHVRVKDKIDVMGVGLGAMPLPAIGFTKDVAWTHTVSTGRRFTFFELKMTGNSYAVDGVLKPLTQRVIEVQALEADGSLSTRSRTLYSSEYGPMIVHPSYGLNWTATQAYAIRDSNYENGRVYDFYLDVAKARTVQELRDALVRQQAATWVNTLAVDRAGSAMYADLSLVPNLSQDKINDCTSSALAKTLLPNRLFVLDGSRSACNWTVDARTITPGIMPTQDMPQNFGTQYFDNSNESAWLPNPRLRNVGLSPVIGANATTQSVRTRMAFQEIEDRLAGTDGLPGNRYSLDALETKFFQSRAMSSELMRPALLTLCSTSDTAADFIATDKTTVNVKDACDVLTNQWDGRMTQNSVGVHVFREFWRRALNVPNVWSVPFNADDPLHTPRSPNITDATVAMRLRTALADGVQILRTRGLPLNAKLGEVQFTARGGTRLPLDGGDEFEGTFNKITPSVIPTGVPNVNGPTTEGYTNVTTGSSYIQAVTFGADAPQARGILTYSQSVLPDSPHYADQTRVFSQSRWLPLPFTDAQIQADPQLKQFTLSE